MKHFTTLLRTSTGLVSLFFLVLAGIEYLAILHLNDGFFVYALDDAYIHLSLAENIWQGHYGVNSGEYSAPSSSIAWPFLMAPFSSGVFFPLLLNLAVSLATIVAMGRILALALGNSDSVAARYVASLLLASLVLQCNLVGLAFTGMEHSLQVFLVVAISLGLVIEAEGKRPPTWLWLAIILAPLVRYENLAVSVSALGYLFLRGHWQKSMLAGMATLLPLAGFSLFLQHLGLEPMPASIKAKSSLVDTGGSLQVLADNLNASLKHRQGTLIAFAASLFFAYAVLGQQRARQWLALVSAGALGLHLLAGNYGWYNRYEIYVWAYLLLLGLYLGSPALHGLVNHCTTCWGKIRVAVALAAVLLATAAPYLFNLGTLPVASNNIYQQQYQMHRFVTSYYRKPVAVNDLGYVSWHNDRYVLDLWGLASPQALAARQAGQGPAWMETLAQAHQAGLAMVFDDWIGTAPPGWIKLGEMHLGRNSVVSGQVVSFYATGEQSVTAILASLQAFVPTLPAGVAFTYAPAATKANPAD